MTRPRVEVRGLGKRYQLSHTPAADSLRELLATWWSRRRQRVAAETFAALDDVSFDVWPGQALALVGSNGSGKSTLLRVLARVTVPTTGSARLQGRVASLLEVGTGFHPELTGRENIYLNGSILGLSRQFVRRRFDSIVDYAGVARFLDTEVKHYSSGMRMRLAFAVAAHVQPDVFIVDEALAVGDAAFQERGLATMRALVAAGCTLLFVSHDPRVVTALATHVLWLAQGRVVAHTADVNDVLVRYNQQTPRDSSC